MKVLLIGSGGREHALAWKLAASPLLEKLYCAPGNPGIATVAELVDISADDHKALIAFAKDKKIDLVVVGPEAPLVAGLSDEMRTEGIRVFGPSKAAAQLEGSKGFTKDLCARFDIPTGAYGRFNNAPKAKAYIRQQGAPIVVKADGLAAGKGVVVAMTLDEALDAVDACFEGAFARRCRGGRRGISGRRRSKLLLHLRWQDGIAAWLGAGSQARGRRRHRPQYRRHGCLCTCPGHDAGNR